MSEFRTFEDLDCWQACRELRLFVSKEIVPDLPKEERFRLIDQLLRSSRSTTANIAEGYGRFHYQETIKYCCDARGSCYEVLDHFITAVDEELLPEGASESCRPMVEKAVKLINGYIRYLKQRKDSDGKPG